MSTNDLAIENNIEATAGLPLWLTISLIIGTLFFALKIYLSERGQASRSLRFILAALRTSVLLLILWMLFGWTKHQFHSQRPDLLVILDTSGSMSTLDIERNRDRTSRLSHAKDLAHEALKRAEITQNYNMRCFTIGEQTVALPADQLDTALDNLNADGNYSRLGSGIKQLINAQVGSSTAAIVFISDGINTSATTLAEAARLARVSAIPFYCLATGRNLARPDLRISEVLIDSQAYLGDRVSVVASIGTSVDASTKATIRLIDQTNDEQLDQVTIDLGKVQGDEAVLSFVPEQPGKVTLKVEVLPIDGEEDTDNNFTSVDIEVLNEPIKVLMVFDRPSYEFRFLKHFLERTIQIGDTEAATFELECVLQEADAEYVRQDDTAIRLVPNDPELLAEYDVFVFGSLNPSLIPRSVQETIVDCVASGGSGCIFIHGNADAGKKLARWPLARLLPVDSQQYQSSRPLADELYRWQPTRIGRLSSPLQISSKEEQNAESLWERMPQSGNVVYLEQTKPAAQVLLEVVGNQTGLTSPALITQYAGAGRVVLQATDETYLWTSIQGSDLYHQRYWGQMLRWLSRGRISAPEDSRLAVTPQHSQAGQSPVAKLTLGDGEDVLQQAQVTVTGSESGESQSTQRSWRMMKSESKPKTHTAELNDLTPGIYEASVQTAGGESLKCSFSVVAPPTERSNTQADWDAMRELAVLSRGRFYTAESQDRLLDELPAGVKTRLGSRPPKPIWNSGWVASLFIVLLTGEWLLRRRARML